MPDDWYYAYRPSLAAGVVFLTAFSLLALFHLGVTIKSRVWWTVVRLPSYLTPTTSQADPKSAFCVQVIALGGLCEVLGWAGRLWSWKNPVSFDSFLMQTICLVIAPCFFSAACYSITGILIRIVGPEYSLFR